MALKPPEEQTVLQRYLPIVKWLPKYRWSEGPHKQLSLLTLLLIRAGNRSSRVRDPRGHRNAQAIGLASFYRGASPPRTPRSTTAPGYRPGR
jgi:hypothetical protein